MVNASCVLQRSVSPAGCRVVMCSTGGRVAVAAPVLLQNSAPLPHPPSVSQILLQYTGALDAADAAKSGARSTAEEAAETARRAREGAVGALREGGGY